MIGIAALNPATVLLCVMANSRAVASETGRVIFGSRVDYDRERIVLAPREATHAYTPPGYPCPRSRRPNCAAGVVRSAAINEDGPDWLSLFRHRGGKRRFAQGLH